MARDKKEQELVGDDGEKEVRRDEGRREEEQYDMTSVMYSHTTMDTAYLSKVG